MSDSQMSQSDLEETGQFVDQCIELIVKEDKENAMFGEIGSYLEPATSWRSADEEAVKDEIKALAESLEERRHEAAGDKVKLQEQETQQVKKELAQAVEHRTQAAKHLEQIAGQQESCDRQSQALQKKKIDVEKQTSVALPRTRHDVNLYSYLTCIRWQYDCEPHEVKGYISSKNKAKTFALNTQLNSQFFITNYLWDQLEPDW